jgi:putative N-acetyltransferase (TIGR04045 family)
MSLYEDRILPFMPGEFHVKLADEAWERQGHYRLRREIFCDEQGIFADDDRDALDNIAYPMVALSCIAGAGDQVVGVVRIHQPEPGLWWGSRLGVHRQFRRVGSIGAELVRLAVCTATARGCRTFLAHVQSQNVKFFERLHWTSRGELLLHGLPHHLMSADLAYYPPHGLDTRAFLRPQWREPIAA